MHDDEGEVAGGDGQHGVGRGVRAVDDDDDLPRLVHPLRAEGVEEQWEPVRAAVRRDDDRGRRVCRALLHATSGRVRIRVRLPVSGEPLLGERWCAIRDSNPEPAD